MMNVPVIFNPRHSFPKGAAVIAAKNPFRIIGMIISGAFLKSTAPLILQSDYTPAAPDAEQARKLAVEELSRVKYQTNDSLWDRLLEWFSSLLDRLFSGQTGSLSISEILTLVLIGIVIIALIIFAFRIGVRLRNKKTENRKETQNQSLFLNDSRSAAELFAAADSAEQAEDFSTAAIERFRGVIRNLDERKLILLHPGMTAFEATRQAVESCGAHDLFFDCAQWFNNIFYGSAEADFTAAERTSQLAQYVREFSENRPKGFRNGVNSRLRDSEQQQIGGFFE
ncbi:hypothetical protein RQN30_04545 [Arcanobacterium hippocoleae]